MSYLAGSLRKRLRILGLLAVPLGASPALANYATPIGFSTASWNRDVVFAAGDWNDGAAGFDGTSTTSDTWYQSGAYGMNGETSPGGLPALGTVDGYTNSFVSHAAPLINSKNTVFQFQPFDNADSAANPYANNCLFLGDSNNAVNTLTLAAPARYLNLAIMAASSGVGNGRETCTLVLNFTNGTSSAGLAYDGYDWGNLGSPSDRAVFSSNVQRSTASGSHEHAACSPQSGSYYQMYESDIDLQSLAYADEPIASITFAEPNTMGYGGYIGIFAVSGVENTDPPPTPEPATLVFFAVGGLALLVSRRRRKR